MADHHSVLKNGSKILIDKQPYVILENEFVNPGKGQAFTRIKIKNLLNKKTLERTVKIGEILDIADVENCSMQFLYRENSNLFFMNNTTYEQYEVDSGSLEFDERWLIDGENFDIVLWNGQIIDVELPNACILKVKATDSVTKGDTVSATLKDAELENGINIKVPSFIKEGEIVKINPTNSEYMSRVKND